MSSAANLRLGNHLKRLREERKLTLGGVESLSAGFGERINKSYLFRVERGKTLPTIQRLRVLAKVYHVKLSRLVEFLDSAFEELEQRSETAVDLDSLSFDDLRARGIEAERAGEFARAILLFHAALRLSRSEAPSPENQYRLAVTQHDLAIVLQASGRLEMARENGEAALECDGLPGDLLHKICLNLAVTYRRLGQVALARQLLSGLLAEAEDLDREVLAGTHTAMGSSLLRSKSGDAALHYRSALRIVRTLKNPFDECILLHNIGIAESRAGNLKRALGSLLRSRDLAKRKDFNFWVAKAQTEIGKTLYLLGDRQEARLALREAHAIARQRDYWEQLFLTQYYIRRIALDEDDMASAAVAEASLKFFSIKLEESFDELEAFRREIK